MAAQLFHIPFPTAFNSNGLAVPGAKCYFYVTGGTTAAPVYTTSALNVQHTQPVVANGAGRFASVYLNDAITYRCVIQDDQGVELNDEDPYTWGGTTLNNAATFNNSDAGVASGTTFDGATARTIARNTFGLATTDSPMFTGVNVGHATDTTVTRSSAGNIAVEGNLIYRAGGTDVPVADGGTGASTAADARTNLGIPNNYIGSTTAIVSGGLQMTGLTLSSYSMIEIVLQDLKVTTDDSTINLTFFIGAVEITAAYRFGSSVITSGGSTSSDVSSSAASILLTDATAAFMVGNDTREIFCGRVSLFGPTNSLNKLVFMNTVYNTPSGSSCYLNGSGCLDNTGSIDGIRVEGSSDLTAGKMILWGHV